MEDFLLPGGMDPEQRQELMDRVHRAGDRDAPESVDLVLYQDGLPSDNGTYNFSRTIRNRRSRRFSKITTTWHSPWPGSFRPSGSR